MIAGMIGLCISMLYLSYAPVKYEVTASIIVSRVADKNFLNPEVLIFQMNKTGAFDNIAWGDCMPKISRKEKYQIYDFLKINKSDISLFIESSVPNEATVCANNILGEINAFENELLLKLKERNSAYISNLRSRLNTYKQLLDINNSLRENHFIALGALEGIEEKIKLAKDEELLINNFLPTMFNQEIDEIRKPSKFRILIVLIAGLLGGASIGILFLCRKLVLNLIKQNLRVGLC